MLLYDPMTVASGFYAYASESDHRSDTIEAAIRAINERKVADITSWRSLKIGGKIVITEVLNGIELSDMFLCDLTGLNPNVLFELGYAIGLRKRVWITLDATKEKSSDLLHSLDIVSAFGYRSYANDRDIMEQFLGDSPYFDLFSHPLAEHDGWIDRLISSTADADVFYIPSSVESTAVTRLLDYFDTIKRRNRRKVVVRDKIEDSYDTLRLYLRNMLDSNAVIAHLDDPDSPGAQLNNARCSLFAGMALGFGRKVLLIAPAPFDAPLDYRDMLVAYEDSGHCREAVEKWLREGFMTRIEPKRVTEDPEHTLLAFRIGETTAENEEPDLENYFVPTPAYSAGVRSRIGVFVGRKGTGKTANLFRIRDHFETEKRNIVVVIKPVSFRIAAFERLIEEFFPQPDMASDFIERTWRAIVYAEIAKPLCSLIEGDTRYSQATDEESSVLAHVERYRRFVEAEFAEKIDIIRDLVSKVVERGESPKAALHAIAEQFSGPLVEAYSTLLQRYQKIVVLVDNLDKAWSISGQDRTVQTRLIAGLLDFQNTIRRELSLGEGDVRVLVFLREDIFSRVIEDAYERDKVRLVLSRIAWPDSERLVEVLEKRFLACSPGLSTMSLWDDLFCPKVSGVATKRYLLERVMPRPRDLIHVVKTAIDNCVGREHSRIEADDLKDALREYYLFLIDNMFTEYGAYLSTLQVLVQSFAGSRVRHNQFQVFRIVRPCLNSWNEFGRVVEFLFRVSFLGVESRGRVQFAYTNDDVERLLPIVRRGLRWLDVGRTVFAIHPAFHAGLQLEEGGS